MLFRTRPSRGLSSFEILTVVAIILAVSSVGVVTYRNTRKSLRINSGAEELVKVMEVARNMAISQNTYFGVRVDMTGGSFWVDELEIEAMLLCLEWTRQEFVLLGWTSMLEIVTLVGMLGPGWLMLDGLTHWTVSVGFKMTDALS